jgi:hypothetical protein
MMAGRRRVMGIVEGVEWTSPIIEGCPHYLQGVFDQTGREVKSIAHCAYDLLHVVADETQHGERRKGRK